MNKKILNTIIKACFVGTAAILLADTAVNNDITGNFLFENDIPAKAASAQDGQYIPKNLDYSEVIRAIKAEEGIKEDTSVRRILYDDDFSTDGIKPSEYRDIADEAIQSAVKVSTDEEIIYFVKRALFFYKQYLKTHDTDMPSLLGAGKCETFLGRRTNAKNYLMKAYAMYPNNPKVHKYLGDFNFKFADYNMALEFYNLSLSSGNLKDYPTNIATAVTYEKLGDTKNALMYYKISLYLNPNSELAKSGIEEYEEKEKTGYEADSRKYFEYYDKSEDNDADIETLIIDSMNIK